MSKIPVIAVVGATASGKTSLAISLAKRFRGEIISADSMQVYKELNIGTAKPTEEEKDGVPHHIMDVISPKENFSVAEFVEKAHKTAAEITARGNNVILAGGTGLYIDSFIRDVDFNEEEELPELRRELAEKAQKEGAESLLSDLAAIDPKTAETLHPNNVKRIIRAIEFYKIHNMPISEHKENTKQKISRYRALYLMINHPREVLYDRINRRVDIMMQSGLEEEARMLWNRKETLGKTALQAIGYKELFAYFDGTLDLKSATEEIKLRSRQYAKRQLTWFRRNDEIHLLNPENAEAEAEKLCEEFLK